MGRVWECPHGAGVMFSLALEPRTPTELLPPLSLVIADAVCDAVGAGSGVRWPNDVVVGDRKLCGVLVEHREGKLVAGVGLNANLSADQLPAEPGWRRPHCRSRPAPRSTEHSSWPTCCGRSNSATWHSSGTDSPDSSTTTCGAAGWQLAGGLEGRATASTSSGRLVVAGVAHSSAEVTAVTVADFPPETSAATYHSGYARPDCSRGGELRGTGRGSDLRPREQATTAAVTGRW